MLECLNGTRGVASSSKLGEHKDGRNN